MVRFSRYQATDCRSEAQFARRTQRVMTVLSLELVFSSGAPSRAESISSRSCFGTWHRWPESGYNWDVTTVMNPTGYVAYNPCNHCNHGLLPVTVINRDAHPSTGFHFMIPDRQLAIVCLIIMHKAEHPMAEGATSLRWWQQTDCGLSTCIQERREKLYKPYSWYSVTFHDLCV